MQDLLIQKFLRVTEVAAIASYAWVGKNDKHAADDAATEAMRNAFHSIEFDGTVVIGEGERDEAPMLFIGEKLGTGKGPKIDIAVDPLDGTNLAATGADNAVCVLAAAPEHSLFHAPDTYMEKIAVGPKIGNVVSLSKSVEENLDAIAKKTGKKMSEITVVVLERPRHDDIVKRVKAKGANVKFIQEGDVFGAIITAFDQTLTSGQKNDVNIGQTEFVHADILMGVGAAPEGVIAATALKILGGYFEGRLKPRDDADKARAIKMGAKVDKIYTIDELVKGNDLVFVATGVTNGYLMNGVKKQGDTFITNSMYVDSKTKSARFIETKYKV